jgi:hypothetical protein
MIHRNATRATLIEAARRRTIAFSLLHIESAVVISFTFVFVMLCWFGALPMQTWWLWLMLGAVGEVALVWRTSKNSRLLLNTAHTLLNERFNATRLGIKEFQAVVAKALYLHHDVVKQLEHRPELDAGSLAHDMDEWVIQFCESLYQLDAMLQAPAIVEHMHTAIIASQRKSAHVWSFDERDIVLTNTNRKKSPDYDRLTLLRTVTQNSQQATKESLEKIASLLALLKRADMHIMSDEQIAQLHELIVKQAQSMTSVKKQIETLQQIYGVK